jgi:hypothetical protein
MVDEDRFGGRPIPGRLAARWTGGHTSHTCISYRSTSGEEVRQFDNNIFFLSLF